MRLTSNPRIDLEALQPGFSDAAWHGELPSTEVERAELERLKSYLLDQGLITPTFIGELDKDLYARLLTAESPPQEMSYSPEADNGRANWLRKAGLVLPDSWFTSAECHTIRESAHPYVVTLTIIAQWLTVALDKDLSETQTRRYINFKLLERLNLKGDRVPDPFFGWQAREDHIRENHRKRTNPSATVSPLELLQLMEIIKHSFGKSQQATFTDFT